MEMIGRTMPVSLWMFHWLTQGQVHRYTSVRSIFYAANTFLGRVKFDLSME